jgi:type IV secretion system protein VirB4
MGTVDRTRSVRGELIAADRIPYSVHLSDSVVRTSSLDYLQVFRLGGVSFESADDEQLNNWHERLNILWRNIASPNVALWTHVIRRREATPWQRGPDGGFGAALLNKYRERLAHESLMVNELYLSTVYRPAESIATGLLSNAIRRFHKNASRVETSDALDACAKLSQTIQTGLARYEPEQLGTYRAGGNHYSALSEFLAHLINAEWRRVPLTRMPLNEALATSRLFFGTEAIEYRTPTATRAAAILGIKEYPTPNVVGMYNRLLSAPFSYVLTQSFAFLSKGASQGLLQRQFHRLSNAGDFGVSQAQELKSALDSLSSNEFVMGDHHLSLQVIEDIAGDDGSSAGHRLRALNESVALARTMLADTGMTVAREDLALEAAYWGQLPGYFPMRARKAPISSRNFAAMAAFHNYPAGRATGNHWGDALTLLMTSARSPYYFSLHASDPHDPDGGSRKDTGHTFMCGPTGSGKTVLIGFLVAMLDRMGATQVIFDKDRGLEILVRALGGEYLPLKHGLATGFNPLQLTPSPANVEFLKLWLRTLVRSSGGEALSVRQQQDLEQALHGTLALERGMRRLSRLVEFLDPTDPEGMHARLTPWCSALQGDYAWVFDNAEDSLLARLSAHATIGFDVTEFLNHERTRAPVTLYLFHLVRELLDGRKLVCWMDEFWRLLGDPAFEGLAKDGPKTWRKLNGVMCLATQSASDVLDSPISRTIIEQTATKIFFPNADADAEEYMSGFGLTEREYKLVKERLEPGSRMFLIKQAHQSVVCQLDLKGFDAELKVISGRNQEVQRMHQIMASRGSCADDWLPSFVQSNGVLPVAPLTLTEEPRTCP